MKIFHKYALTSAGIKRFILVNKFYNFILMNLLITLFVMSSLNFKEL